MKRTLDGLLEWPELLSFVNHAHSDDGVTIDLILGGFVLRLRPDMVPTATRRAHFARFVFAVSRAVKQRVVDMHVYALLDGNGRLNSAPLTIGVLDASFPCDIVRLAVPGETPSLSVSLSGAHSAEHREARRLVL